MSEMDSFFPSALFVPFLILAFVKHEIAEWAYERAHGLQGRSVLFGLVVDTTAAIGQFGGYLLLVAYGYDHGWLKAIALWVITLLIAAVDQIFPVLLKRFAEPVF